MKSPKFICSKSKLLQDYKNLHNKLDFKISYSAKTNVEIIKILEENTKCDFSVHMKEELPFISDMKRVLFLAQGWTKEEIEELVEQKITKFVVDNIEDLNTLTKFLDNHEVKVDLLLRIKMKEHTIFTGKYYVFGMTASVANQQIPILRKNKNICTLGIHFHRKTQNTSEWNLKNELKSALSNETWKAIDTINIGGGLPVEYKNSSDQSINFIFSKIQELKEFIKQHNINLVVEPGRFLAAPCVKLHTTIKQVIGDQIIVDASVYNSAMDTLIAPLKLLVEGELPSNSKEGKEYTIKGITPCSLDIFRYKVRLPNSLAKGDNLVFVNAGAYNFRTDFCELPKIETDVLE